MDGVVAAAGSENRPFRSAYNVRNKFGNEPSGRDFFNDRNTVVSRDPMERRGGNMTGRVVRRDNIRFLFARKVNRCSRGKPINARGRLRVPILLGNMAAYLFLVRPRQMTRSGRRRPPRSCPVLYERFSRGTVEPSGLQPDAAIVVRAGPVIEQRRYNNSAVVVAFGLNPSKNERDFLDFVTYRRGNFLETFPGRPLAAAYTHTHTHICTANSDARA